MSLSGYLCLVFAIQHPQKEQEEIENINNQHMVEIRGINYQFEKCDCEQMNFNCIGVMPNNRLRAFSKFLG